MQFIGIFFLISIALEILSIILVSKMIGGLAAFALIILSFFVGSFLIRRNAGISKVLMAGELLRNKGQISWYQMLLPIRIPLAGFLLMIPGFLSSIVALLLLIPFKGKPIASTQNQAHFEQHFAYGQRSQSSKPHDDDIIDSDFVVQPKSNDNTPAKLENRS
ncbi:FxsA family protein [Kingella kingae]|uniref:FxsA family protein n=1 Tax=Kingella kingae TaxID=504 RepID=UPI0004079928|nr:FxsA family protein [Kingella kingae]MDK4526755.1 FxsA family protein [Kingella kingae]MDK4532786.1 FxsA family protein [Kingella kingae]